MSENYKLFDKDVITNYNHSTKNINKNDVIDINNSKNLYYIISGEIEVYSELIDGSDIYVSTLSNNDCFGLSNLFTNKEIKTKLICSKNAEIIIFSKDTLIQMLQKDFGLLEQLITYYNIKIDFLLSRLSELCIQSARKKLAQYILKNSYRKMMNIDKLALYLGISRASLFRELSYLKSNNYIQISKKNIIILDLDGLKKYKRRKL